MHCSLSRLAIVLGVAVVANAEDPGTCFAYIVTPTYSHRWVHINVKCHTTDDCKNVCDCDAVCTKTDAGCNVMPPPTPLHAGCKSMPNATCMDVFCPYLHEKNGTACGICPNGTAAEGTCSRNCSRYEADYS